MGKGEKSLNILSDTFKNFKRSIYQRRLTSFVGFLYGYSTSDSHNILGITLWNNIVEQNFKKEYDTLKTILPTGIIILGLVYDDAEPISEDTLIHRESIPNDGFVIMPVNMETIDFCEAPLFYSYSLNTNAMSLMKTMLLDQMSISSCLILFRVRCQLCVDVDQYEGENDDGRLISEMNKLTNKLTSNTTLFQFESLKLLLQTDPPMVLAGESGVSSNALCQDLYKFISRDESDRDFYEAERKPAKSLISDDDSLTCHGVKVVFRLTGPAAVDSNLTCVPVIHQETKSDYYKIVNIPLKLDCLVYALKSMKISELPPMFKAALSNQLDAMHDCLVQYKKDGQYCTPKPYHFQINSSHISTVYPHTYTESELVCLRKKIHQLLLLPLDRPKIRISNRYFFPGEGSHGQLLKNCHLSALRGKITGRISCVQGNYHYHHYMQDGIDDSGWGCAYRSLQTLWSWFLLQGYTESPVPTHGAIQRALVDVGDKPERFVGCRDWIGSIEVSNVLNHCIGVTSKIMFVGSGATLASKGRELLYHFDSQGTPIMIGGGVYAHTIVGICFNDSTGETNFLILDPHYAGGEDIKTIVHKGWCAWKGKDFWDKTSYYNLCMPQRFVMI